MKDHLIRKEVLRKCRICETDLADKLWLSQWEANQHYKVNICDKCGKKTWLKVDFDGSGDDDWKPDEEERKEQ